MKLLELIFKLSVIVCCAVHTQSLLAPIMDLLLGKGDCRCAEEKQSVEYKTLDEFNHDDDCNVCAESKRRAGSKQRVESNVFHESKHRTETEVCDDSKPRGEFRPRPEFKQRPKSKVCDKCKPCSESKPSPGSKYCAEFGVEMTWSSNGPIDGKSCIQWTEPWDLNGWDNNYLCFDKDYGVKWSHAGPIDGMKCALVNEPIDADGWWDNYACVPNTNRWQFDFRPFNNTDNNSCCLKIEEPSETQFWTDNFLCLDKMTI